VEAAALVEVLSEAALAVDELVRSMSPKALLLRADGHNDQFQVDVEADRAVREVLERQGLGVLSEESGRHPGEVPILVVVDPIDGSTNCSRQISHYGPSLCALDEKGPLAAVVHNVHTSTTYRALRGEGATRNGSPIGTAVRRSVDLIMTGDPCRELEGPAWTRVSGASAHDLCLVADGSIDGYVDHRNTQSVWDYLGAALVIWESGGAVRERGGFELVDLDARADRRLIAATSPEQLETLDRLVASRLLGDRR
jgi:fructose-1,6-bisphosphatase/inositol monophosphatase family enzyme